MTIAVPKSMLDQLKDDELNKVFRQFVGMDTLYAGIVKEYHKVSKQNDVYSQSYIAEKKKEAVNSIHATIREHADRANVIIEYLVIEHSVKADVKEVPTDTQERIAYELQRQSDMKRWELQLETFGLEQLKTMYDKHWGEEDFQALFTARMADLKEENLTMHSDLNWYIDSMKINPATRELDKLKYSINLFANMDSYPANLENGLTEIRYRNINTDLNIPESFDL